MRIQNMQVRNIYCVGRNYAAHAAELGNAVPDQPLIFSKPTNALVEADGRVIRYPSDQGEIHHEVELVLYIGRDIIEEDFKVDEVVTKMALGVDLTLRDVQSELKKKGHPWLLAKGFKSSAIVTEFWDFPGSAACKEKDFSLKHGKNILQKGNIASMIFSFQALLSYLQKHFGLREGDLIFTGTPEGVGPIQDGASYELWWGEDMQGSFLVSLSEEKE